MASCRFAVGLADVAPQSSHQSRRCRPRAKGLERARSSHSRAARRCSGWLGVVVSGGDQPVFAVVSALPSRAALRIAVISRQNRYVCFRVRSRPCPRRWGYVPPSSRRTVSRSPCRSEWRSRRTFCSATVDRVYVRTRRCPSPVQCFRKVRPDAPPSSFESVAYWRRLASEQAGAALGTAVLSSMNGCMTAIHGVWSEVCGKVQPALNRPRGRDLSACPRRARRQRRCVRRSPERLDIRGRRFADYDSRAVFWSSEARRWKAVYWPSTC